jgi:hypothetical protein
VEARGAPERASGVIGLQMQADRATAGGALRRHRLVLDDPGCAEVGRAVQTFVETCGQIEAKPAERAKTAGAITVEQLKVEVVSTVVRRTTDVMPPSSWRRL